MRTPVLALSVALGILLAPLAVEAQPAGKVWRIGAISSEIPSEPPGQGPFWERMRELGWVYGQNVVEKRRAFGERQERVPELATELMRAQVDVFLVGAGSTAKMVQDVTRSIPIVATGGDLVATGVTLEDVEHVLLTGAIVEKQKDQQTGEAKYLVEGGSLSGERTTVVAKIGPTGRLVIITVYLSTSEDES